MPTLNLKYTYLNKSFLLQFTDLFHQENKLKTLYIYTNNAHTFYNM